ncbi:MAG: lytic transglycosylase domain-containing protein [Longimicrobiales bacterium]
MQDRRERGQGESTERRGVERREPEPGEKLRDEKAAASRDAKRAVGVGLAASTLAMLAGTLPKAAAPPSPEKVPIDETPVVEKAKQAEWDLTVSDHDRVDFFIDFLTGKNRDKPQLWLERIGVYEPMIRKELGARGMPGDLVYLSMIESGFNPNAYSRADAAGLWQFIEETGRRHGLEVSEYVDERRDPVKSTGAALEYLQQMHGRFGSWYLAAAGYNTGENRVGRLMREITGGERGEDAQYWTIWDRLPRETRDYVPLMLAAGHIAKDPEKYGFTGVQRQDPLEFEEIIVPGGTKLSAVASAGGVDVEALRALNPHLVKEMTPPGRRMAVRVPIGRADTVAANLKGQAEPGATYRAD